MTKKDATDMQGCNMPNKCGVNLSIDLAFKQVEVAHHRLQPSPKKDG